jgi:hypothetical protein
VIGGAVPYSQFDPTATLFPNGAVRVSGTVEPATDAGGNPVARAAPVHFHFLLVQDGRHVSGRSESSIATWATQTAAVREDDRLRPGRARACGFSVTPVIGPPAAFDTFVWFDELTLELAGQSGG